MANIGEAPVGQVQVPDQTHEAAQMLKLLHERQS